MFLNGGQALWHRAEQHHLFSFRGKLCDLGAFSMRALLRIMIQLGKDEVPQALLTLLVMVVD
jgi:hypothetical protein